MSDDRKGAKPLANALVSALGAAADAFEKNGISPEEAAAVDARNTLERATTHASEVAFAIAETALVERLRGVIPSAEVETYRLALRRYHDRVVDLMESPIERIMLPWLITIDIPRLRTKVVRTARPQDDAYDRELSLTLIPQLSIGRHRLDFALVLRKARHTLIVDVECDGREFHNDPSDAARDRYLAALGIMTVRATGSEIHKQPWEAANRVADVVAAWLR